MKEKWVAEEEWTALHAELMEEQVNCQRLILASYQTEAMGMNKSDGFLEDLRKSLFRCAVLRSACRYFEEEWGFVPSAEDTYKLQCMIAAIAG